MACLMCCWGGTAGQAAEPSPPPTRVELMLNEELSRTVAWPVTTGVPFPRGSLASETNCRLVDDRGRECPLQSRVAATWDAAQTSVRWLTVDFIASPGRQYFLEFGPAVRRASLPQPNDREQLKIVKTGNAEQPEKLKVATGPLEVVFSASGASGLETIALDIDGDGQFAANEVVAQGPADGEHYYIDQAGRRFSSSLAAPLPPKKGPPPANAATEPPSRQIMVESQGPVRTVIRVDGSYWSPGQATLVRYRTRYHFFAGSALVKVIDEFRVVGSTRDVRFRDIGFALRLAPRQGDRYLATDSTTSSAAPVPSSSEEMLDAPFAANPSGANSLVPAPQPVRIPWSPGMQGVSSYQSEYRHLGNRAYEAGVVAEGDFGSRQVVQTDRAAAWLQTVDERAAVTGSLRWFWQQFPKEWEATPDQMVLHLWSPRAGELDFGAPGIQDFFGPAGDRYVLNWFGISGTPTALSDFFYYACREFIENNTADAAGIRKHHEFYLHFAPPGNAAEGAQLARLAECPPLALASGDWNCSTGVFGPLVAREPANNSQSPGKEADDPNQQDPKSWKTTPTPSGSPSQAPSRLSSDEATAELAQGEAVVDRIFQLGRYGQDTFGDYGWWLFGAGPHYSYQWDAAAGRHYADPRRFDFHTYQKETQLWWCYLRGGERKFWDWCLPSENHWTDIAVNHIPLQYGCDWKGGDRADSRRTLHFRPGDWAIDSPVHYLRHHNTAEAWLRGGAQFWASYHRTLETTTLAYYLTGDERFAEVIDYWKDYFTPLAGKNSQSPDFTPWHQEQAWFDPGATVTINGQTRPKTWAEMVRDYAPFSSGLRHQMTLWFNLSTLYEHTWDEQVGQVAREYADAFLTPAGPSGVWHCQENNLPANAPTPTMAHFWSPALWKYDRATGDPRLKEILPKYFSACYLADPFRLSGDVGVYSNLHGGYGYYFTGDPRYVRWSLDELQNLSKHAAPLAKPEDLNRRIYNPYATIESLAGVPRLLWAVQAAQRKGEAIPPSPPLPPQRTVLALHKQAGQPLECDLWGFDQELTWLNPAGQPVTNVSVTTSQHYSPVQPFDRVLPRFEVYAHHAVIPAAAPAGWYLLVPRLEMGVLATNSDRPPLCHAGRPIQLAGGASCWLAATSPSHDMPLSLRSAAARELRVTSLEGTPLPFELNLKAPRSELILNSTAVDSSAPASLDTRSSQIICITNAGNRSAWFQVEDVSDQERWVAFTPGALSQPAKESTFPSGPAVATALQRLTPPIAFDAEQTLVAGRFGQAALVVPGRKLVLPDHLPGTASPQEEPAEETQLFDLREGTLEFFVKKLWDDRLDLVRPAPFLNNGLISSTTPTMLPLGEWAHVAVVWRPYNRDPEQTCMHVYIDGLDRGSYRSTWWEGYSNRPHRMPSKGTWLKGLVSQATGGGAFALDDVRLSTTARYTDRTVKFGNRQTVNPFRFTPPHEPLPADKDTALLFRFDGNLNSEQGAPQPLSARWEK